MEKRAEPGAGDESKSNVRFGPFELNLRRGELREEGRRIRLQEQPLQILRIVLESPGEVVSRDEIRKRLWPEETVVEFDHSINAAIRRLRNALWYRESQNDKKAAASFQNEVSEFSVHNQRASAPRFLQCDHRPCSGALALLVRAGKPKIARCATGRWSCI
jgi:DNA-binding winged helix-turn-helix (wHTH) protein